ncbi:MAG TPA: PIN domain-containing protein [Gammaproteobacteria bacterium]|nr:PIN domain-containing protein [Gammaproteobacteria bacterium]
MIAVDTSTLSALLAGEQGKDVDSLADSLARSDVRLPPVVLTEILSDPATAKVLAPRLLDLELLEVTEGYWQRAGEARAKLQARGLKAKVADALIAQSCIDHDIALLTRDQDFRHFAKHCGLSLA